MVKLTVNPDDGTLAYEWTGRPGTGSLYQMAVESNYKLVNALDLRELWCAMLCVKFAAFPMGKGEKAYRHMLELWDKGEVDVPDIRNAEEKAQMGLPEIDASSERLGGRGPTAPPAALGRFRKYVVQRAGEGCNAPTDSYLRIAHDIKTTGEVQSGNEY